MDDGDRRMLTRVAAYQWGAAAAALFDGDPEVTHTSSGRPRQVLSAEGRLATYGTDGRFTLGIAGGRRLDAALDFPEYRVVVGDESEPFVRDGKNVFNKFVAVVDEQVRGGDEVAVVHEQGDVLAVGRAELDAQAMLDFESGMAVRVRDAAGSDD